MKRGIEDYAKDTIRRLVPGVQDAGFLRTILEANWREDFADDEVVEVDSGEPSLTKAIYIRNMSEEYRTPFLCDLYFVAPELQTYWLYEIEDTNPISREKLQKLRRWIDYFGDETEWAGRLIVTRPRDGRTSVFVELTHPHFVRPASNRIPTNRAIDN